MRGKAEANQQPSQLDSFASLGTGCAILLLRLLPLHFVQGQGRNNTLIMQRYIVAGLSLSVIITSIKSLIGIFYNFTFTVIRLF